MSAVETQPNSRVVAKRQRKERQPTSLSSHGEPFVWLAGGAMAICLAMIVGLLALVLWQGGGTFWPGRVVVLELLDGTRLSGEVNVEEDYEPAEQAYLAMLASRLKLDPGLKAAVEAEASKAVA